MNDEFGTTLTMLMDEVADAIHPRADFEAVRDGHVPLAPAAGPARFRRSVGIAAAAVVLAGGGVAAYRATDDDTGSLATSSPATAVTATSTTIQPTSAAPPTTVAAAIVPSPATEATTKVTAPVARTAQVAGVDVSRGAPVAKFVGTAPAGDIVRVSTPFGSADVTAGESGSWYVLVTLAGALPGETTATVTFSGSADSVTLPVSVPAAPVTMPKQTTLPPTTVAVETTVKPVTTEPKEEQPVATEFTATLGWTEGDGTPLESGLWGKGAPGSVVTATSSAGSATATVRADGTWEMILRLEGVAPGAKVGIRVTNSASAKVHEFTAKAPPSEVAEVKPFTAQLGAADLAIEPAKQMIVGTGAPGSVVRAESSYGVAEAVVGSTGGYELKLKLAGMPVGASAGIRVTNSASTSVFEFTVVKQAPPVIGFSANAAFVECDSTPPFNEYWGKAAVGATITISSPYGGGQVTAGADGKWAARIEFPDAPVGQMFDVVVSSSQGGSASFPFVRVLPA